MMNSTKNSLTNPDKFEEAFAKNTVIVFFGIMINTINGILVVTFFKNSIFHDDPRYILYIHLVINDMLMIFTSVTLYVLTYAWPFVNVSVCCILLLIGSTTYKNTPLNLAGMAIERYIAICKPLHHPQICTVHRTYIFIYFIWTVGVAPSVTDIIIVIATKPLSVFMSFIFCYPLSIFNTKYHEALTTAVQVIYMSFVWIVLIFTYIRVLLTAKKAAVDSSAKKAQSTILLHGIQLLLCMLSYLTPVLDMILIPFFPAHRTKITFFNYLLTNIIPRLLSPLIYGIRDHKFLKHMKGYFSCRLIFVKVRPK
ncbi:odorant receptor 131-2-like [Chanos chanos]|uniref:Odorant receptor 131-2-like n=1 Tax=Chanos chanos TaxID=29144 RepID=A0A6J2VSP8_CHACN|nr:odorant receptor 131-2-like [Chanos chanos]